MLGMAKRPRPPQHDQPRARAGKSVNVWIPDELHAALMAFIDSQDPAPRKTTTVISALRFYLRHKGYWPRPQVG